MAETSSATIAVVSLPSPDDIERAVAFTREPFLAEGEDPQVTLAPGTARRRALDAALAEIEDGAKTPSFDWRRKYSLLLGLDRLLLQEEPKLVDGTILSAHQVDALSGTLTALLAEAQRNGNGGVALPDLEEIELASPAIPGEEDLEEDEPEEEPQDWSDEEDEEEEAPAEPEDPEDPNAAKRFWFEHATGAGKTVAALGFVEGSRTGGVLILTHRRNLVDQFLGELKTRGYSKRIAPPLLDGADRGDGPVTVETYQWFVRNAGRISDAYTIVICDEAHTALGEKTSGAIRKWGGPIFVGMTATGALIARHVTDLFPTQTSRFDLAQAARRGVIAPLRCVRIPPGPGVRTIAKVPLRRGEVDTEFDQEMLAELLDQQPFNLAIADLYKTRFNGTPGVVYSAGVRHAHNVAKAFQDVGLKARAVSGETPKRTLAQILAAYEKGEIDVLVNAQLLAEGWNSPRATVCLHLAPTASKRVYQQRVGRVTRRHAGKEAGIVVDFVHPATKHDDPVVTLHSLLDRDVYRGGAIVVGPVRRGRGRRLRVERRVVPVTGEENRRIEVFERELWRIAVEHLDYGEQVQWAALAGARVAPTGWRRARAMLHFDRGGELKRTFLLTAVQRNKHAMLRLRALQEIANLKDATAFDEAIEMVGQWPREERREGVRIILQAIADKNLGRRDQANNWIWHCAEFTREMHEEYAVRRWPETKRLLGLLVNSSGGAHARNARRLVQSAREQDRRLAAAILAAAVAHTAEAGEVLNGARTRMSRKPAGLARDLLRNIPQPRSAGGGGARRNSRKRKRTGGRQPGSEAVAGEKQTTEALNGNSGDSSQAVDPGSTGNQGNDDSSARTERRSRRSRRSRVPRQAQGEQGGSQSDAADASAEEAKPRRTRRPRAARQTESAEPVTTTDSIGEESGEKPKARRTRAARTPVAATSSEDQTAVPPKRTRTTRAAKETVAGEVKASKVSDDTEKPKARRTPRKTPAKAAAGAAAKSDTESAEKKPARKRRTATGTAAAAKKPSSPEGD